MTDKVSNEQLAELTPDPTLWCVSIAGPDDVLAVSSRAEAVELASRFNTLAISRFERNPHPYDPLMWAVPTEWPHDADSHAANLGDLGEYAWLRNAQSEAVAWPGQCPDCGCHTKADIQRADGSSDGRVRCVNCKRVFGTTNPAPQSEAVAVKALEWELEEDNWWVSAPDAFFRRLGYEVRITDSGQVRTRTVNQPFIDFDGTAAEAKAAAQADYEQRIRSALTHPAPLLAVTDEQTIIDAYLRGTAWRDENPGEDNSPYRFKAARDYADKTLTAALEAKQ